MEQGPIILETAGMNSSVPWWVLGGYAVGESALVILVFYLLPKKHKWTVWLLVASYFIVVPHFTRYTIEHVMSDPAQGLIVSAYFFDWPRYYPAIACTLLAGVLFWLKRRSAATQEVD